MLRPMSGRCKGKRGLQDKRGLQTFPPRGITESFDARNRLSQPSFPRGSHANPMLTLAPRKQITDRWKDKGLRLRYSITRFFDVCGVCVCVCVCVCVRWYH